MSMSLPPSSLSRAGLAGLLLLGGGLVVLGWSSFELTKANWAQDLRIDGIAASLGQLTSPRRARSPEQQQRLPSALIIGARKSGTRALLEFLGLHPAIRTARYELHYFDQDEAFAKGPEWYRSQMPESLPGDVVMEKTPGYFTSAVAPARVAALDPHMRVLLILRDPVTRTISDYTQVHYTKLSRNKSHDAFESLVFDPTSGALNLDYKPVRNSLYVKHLRRWLKHFPLSQIHIVDGDAFSRDPMPELRAAESFLGLPHSIDSAQLHFNATKGFYCATDHRGRAKCLGDTKGRPHVGVAEDVRRRLATQLRPFSRRFFALAGRTFPDWL